MRFTAQRDTPTPPMDEDSGIQGIVGEDDIEIIEDSEIEELDEDIAYVDTADDSHYTFNKHSGAVFCCAVDSNAAFAASGGQDDKAYAWNIETGEVALECAGHEDSVFVVNFNHDSTLLATGDMSGLVKVWKLSTKEELCQFQASDLTWLQWHHSSNILLAGTTSGEAWMWLVPIGNCKTFQSFGHSSVAGKFLPDGKKAAMGYQDGSVRIWDLKASTAIHTIRAKQEGHNDAVTCLSVNNDGSLVLTGSLDTTAKLINSNNGKVIATFQCETEPSESGEEEDEDRSASVEGVDFFRTSPMAATGTLFGTLAIWDIPTQVNRLNIEQEIGIVKVVCDESAPLVYTGGLDGCIKMYDARSGQKEKQWGAHRREVLDFVVDRTGNVIVSASEDNTCKVFKTNR